MKKTDKNIINRYVRNGIVLGVVFPIASILICAFFLTPKDYSFSIINLHKDFPLLFIIDLAPLVLGTVSYFVGINVYKSNAKLIYEINDINVMLSEKNKDLNVLLDERGTLLKEIHHRVKNNLQVITSLLSLQANFIEDEKSKALLKYSQYRINSMALIHEMLYNSNDISKIDYGVYVKDLVTGLITSMKGADHNIKPKFKIPRMHLNVDTSIPLGLLINEIITNSVKYGCPDDEGIISIEIKHIGQKNYTMNIGDDGKGFPGDINFRNSNSLGLLLIHKLTLQLQGNIEKDNNKKGTNYIVSFSEINQNS